MCWLNCVQIAENKHNAVTSAENEASLQILRSCSAGNRVNLNELRICQFISQFFAATFKGGKQKHPIERDPCNVVGDAMNLRLLES